MNASMTETRRAAHAPVAVPDSEPAHSSAAGLLVYLGLGTLFGSLLIKAEVVSWFRIQEMFRFQSPHMYLTIVSAIATAAISLQVIRWRGLRTMQGEPIVLPPKVMGSGTRYWAGGTLFGLGWALVGACPAPLFALFGTGISVFGVIIASALVGTWLYGVIRPRLPH
jgi:uncharacterized membrane protein YedE/YeeE